jgi:hypothetical protein
VAWGITALAVIVSEVKHLPTVDGDSALGTQICLLMQPVKDVDREEERG